MTMRMISTAVLAGALAASGCATAISGSGDSIARLEKARAENPASESVERSLGIAYFKANRYDDAKTALQQAVATDPKDGVAALYLGLTAEAQNDIPSARKAYQSYLEVGKTRGAKRQIEARLSALKLKEIQLAAKDALAKEAQLSTQPGPRNAVAVMPFQFTGTDTTLRPIERGFAELVTTDLSRVSSLTVVERMRLQALLDEMELQRTNGTAEGSGVHAGRILQVGRMIGGSIEQQGDQLRTNALVTDVATSQLGAPAQDARSLDELFTMEKNIVFGLLNSMNVTPTTAERNAIDQRPTRSLAAFLAFSRGLELEDQGRFDDASRFFDNAVRLDPSFGSAQQKSAEAKSAASGTQVSVQSVESSLRNSTEGAAVTAATQGTTTAGNSTGGGAGSVAEGLNPSAAGAATGGGAGSTTQPAKDPSAGTGGDNPTTKTAKVTIVIHKP